MKIAVYTIALNEEKHVQRWYESVKDADYILIADTGSTDKTIRIAKKLGIKVFNISVKPWRFDDSRNAALALLPDDIDYCVSMDMDETMSEGWRECLEKMTGDCIQYVFNTTWRDEAETVPENKFINNRIHKRHGFRWKWLMHEAIVSDRTDITYEFCEGLEVSHHPDQEKSREQYNHMIEDAYNEYKDARYHVYHGQQLISFGRLDEAKKVWKEYLKLTEYRPEFEIASAWRYLSICEPNKNIKYLKKSLKVYPSRETYLDLAIYYYSKENWNRCFYYSKKGLEIKKKPQSILSSKFAWGYLLDNLLAVSKHNRKLFKLSKKYKDKKLTVNPTTAIAHNFKLFG